jgi:hypothetical protein
MPTIWEWELGAYAYEVPPILNNRCKIPPIPTTLCM